MNQIPPRTEIGHVTCQWCEHSIPVWVGAQKGNRLVSKCPNCGSRATAGPRPDSQMKAEYLAVNSEIESEDHDSEENTAESSQETQKAAFEIVGDSEEAVREALETDDGDTGIARNDDGIQHGDNTGAGDSAGSDGDGEPSSDSERKPAGRRLFGSRR